MEVGDTRFFKDLLKDFSKAEFREIKNLHIELPCLQDFKLGALLLAIENGQEDYDHILRCLEMYNHALDGKVVNHFPTINVLEEKINMIIRDPDFSKALSVISPMTTAYHEVINMIHEITMHNTIAGSRKTASPNITFNCEWFDYPQVGRMNILKDLEPIIHQSKINFTHMDLVDAETEYIKKQDIYVLYDLDKFFSETRVFQMLSKGGEFFDKYVYAKMILSEEALKLDEIQLDESVSQTTMALSLLCNFNFIIPQIPPPG